MVDQPPVACEEYLYLHSTPLAIPSVRIPPGMKERVEHGETALGHFVLRRTASVARLHHPYRVLFHRVLLPRGPVELVRVRRENHYNLLAVEVKAAGMKEYPHFVQSARREYSSPQGHALAA